MLVGVVVAIARVDNVEVVALDVGWDAADDNCNRTLIVSNGWPTMTDAEPATPPAIKSWNGLTFTSALC